MIPSCKHFPLIDEIDRLHKLNSARFKEYSEYRKQFTATADLIKRMRDSIDAFSEIQPNIELLRISEQADAWLKEYE